MSRPRTHSQRTIPLGGWPQRLRRALELDLFELHMQPIVSLRDGRLAHHELLLRLLDEPGGRLVEPARFLAAAERCGLIREIDQMVLGKALALLSGDAGPHVSAVAVNASALSVTDGAMLARLQQGLASAAVEPATLVIELTETAAISDMAAARSFCEGVLALGCGVALDDFGAGFGSFQYLRQLPFSYLKIDGSFVRGLCASRTDQLIVTAIVAIARGMGATTIAEFVGDEDTMRMLREIGVDYAQGFHVGRPQPLLALAA
jgi:EAL domain-containing protein (putative c-di-GMP-specific phosphodiesterase class I)